MSKWVRVVFASDCLPCEDCGDPVCEGCQNHYADCPGPTQDDEWEYKEVKGVMYARPKE